MIFPRRRSGTRLLQEEIAKISERSEDKTNEEPARLASHGSPWNIYSDHIYWAKKLG